MSSNLLDDFLICFNRHSSDVILVLHLSLKSSAWLACQPSSLIWYRHILCSHHCWAQLSHHVSMVLSSHWTPAVAPVIKIGGSFWVSLSLSFFLCQASKAPWCRLSLFSVIGPLFIRATGPLLVFWTALLQDLGGLLLLALGISAVKLNVYPYCVKAFLMVHLANFICASTCSLLWWWYDDVIVCWMFIFLQNSLNVLDVKFVLTSETVLFGSPYSAKMSIVVCIRSSADRPFTFFTIGNLLWKSTIQRRVLQLIMNTSAVTTSHGLHGIS